MANLKRDSLLLRLSDQTFVGFLLILPLAPLLLFNSKEAKFNDLELVASILTQIYISIRSGFLSASGKLTTARLFIFSFYYVSSGLAAEVSSLLNYHSGLDFNLDLNQISLGILLSFLSMVVLDFALPNSEVKVSTNQFKEKNVSGLRIFIVLSFLILIQYIVSTGISSIFSSRESVSQNIAGGVLVSGNTALSGLYIAVTKIFPLIITAYSIILRENFSSRFKKMILINLILLTIINNPISTPRYQFAIFVIVIFFSLSTLSRSRSTAQLAGLILIVVTIFPSLDFGRTADHTFRSFDTYSIFEQLAKKDFDQVLMGTLTLRMTNDNSNDFPIGKQILGEVGAFIPRAFWSGKPLDASIPVARHFNLRNENLSIPLWAEGYLSFRYFGVVIFPLLFGLAFRAMTFAKRPLKVYVLQSFLLGSVFIILRGTLMQYFGLLFAAVLSTWIINRTIFRNAIN